MEEAAKELGLGNIVESDFLLAFLRIKRVKKVASSLLEHFPTFSLKTRLTHYGEMPVLIPLIAASYLIAVYFLLTVVSRLSKTKPSRSHDVQQT
jgi:hypothetical protein